MQAFHTGRLTGAGIVEAAVDVEDRSGRAAVNRGEAVEVAGLWRDPLECFARPGQGVGVELVHVVERS